MFVTVAADARVPWHEEYTEQARRVHRVVFPRVHLRAITVAAEQPAGRPRCHQATSATTVAIQLWIQQTINAG